MSALLDEAWRLGRYSIVGLSVNAIGYGVFLLMVWANLAPTLAASLCYVLGIGLSYLFNRRWTFNSAKHHGQDLPRFLVSHSVGLVSAVGFIVLLTRWLRPEIAQLFNIGLTAIVIYVCLRLTGFGDRDAAHVD
jgi:putative flippase GtrA